MTEEMLNTQRAPAMAYVPVQRIGRVYSAQQALRRGTLYPELDKPFRGRTVEERERTQANRSMEKWAVPFAAWELRLYLDTHPRDRNALSLYRQVCPCAGQGAYACNYPCVGEEDNVCDRWAWVDDPWPWEIAANRKED